MGKSKLEYSIKEKVRSKEERLIKEALDPWLMAFLSNTQLSIKNYYGDTISYPGVKFKGLHKMYFGVII